ncbi:tRNA lysidine(34) synthetase TilS [Enterococcus hulanensis]|uniref:tRNA lysidine(34) synthetase TilS n=1 Tax=Enterococcus TaxID=1350 RepID=UPI000B5A4BCF|nr:MULTISPECIES: tRNA lysidine(34) synthetase TilS [Enterococcus]MBO0409768.1 tRNA lysidine(34) synthetase TilS [Enterococcus hulanensis]OTO20865.1 tRNA(Ile)-lysidine synthetase [Enterococcus sp. 3H8_DIV0648]
MEQEFFRKNSELLTGQKILLAVSTGVDSMVLLHLLEQQNVKIGVVHVNHQLRPESKAEADFLRDYCEKQRLPLYMKVWERPAEKNIEAEARRVRYNFFEKIMEQEKYDLLLTAHHSDDQLETLLMRLTRGGSLAGHSGIARQQDFGPGILLRPLLSFSKEEIYSYAKKEQLTYFEDATNDSQDYFRNRIRKNIVPELKKENPQILTHAQQFHQQLTWANQLIEQALKENLRNIEFDGQRWSFLRENLPNETGARYYFLSAFFQQIEEQTRLIVSQRQLFSLLDQIERPVTQWSVDLGDGWQFTRRYQQFCLEKKGIISDGIFSLNENEQIKLPDGETIALRKSDTASETDAYHVLLPAAVKLPLTIRRRHAGDRIRLSETLFKRINRYFIDKKIPNEQRDQAWVVEDSMGEIVALLPFVNSYLSITTETDRIHYILDYTLQVAK